jgi:tetratricopeptide (TPR) repeat protein
LVVLDAIPNTENAGEPQALPPLALLRAYGELMSSHEEYRPRFDATLNQLVEMGSQDSLVLSTQASNLMSQGSAEAEGQAEDLIARAIQAGSTSTLEAKSGRMQEAVATVLRGLRVNPYSPLLYRDLSLLYLSIHDDESAIRTMKESLSLFPEDSFTRSLLDRTLAATH